MPKAKAIVIQTALSVLAISILACNLSLRTGSSTPSRPTESMDALETTPTIEILPTGITAPAVADWPATVDEILAECPTAAEIAEVDSKITFRFQADPTAGVDVCTAAAGSADLTREQKNAYNAILIMKHLSFDAPLPWTEKTLYDWFTDTISGIEYRSDITTHSCCGTPPVIRIRAELHTFYSDRWTAVGRLMALYVHEARHTYMAHQCEKGVDNRIAELGAYGVEARLYEWLAYHSDPAVLTMLAPGPTNDYREMARHYFHSMQFNMFCLDPTPAGLPPALAAPADPASPVWTERMIQAARSGIPVPGLLLPEADAAVPSKGAVFSWQAVDFPGGVTYGIEVDELFRFGKDWEYWTAHVDSSGLTGASYPMPLALDTANAKLGRWRVWAISPTAGPGPKSEWRYFKIA
jgi:hypothetical protein